MPSNNTVKIEKFAENHFIDGFARKHKDHWEVTLDAVKESLGRIEMLLITSKATMVCEANNVQIIKVEFRVDGTKESAKTSGNRCIVAWHKEEQKVCVLLVYGKTDIPTRRETAAWTKLVKSNYPQYDEML